MTDFQLNIVDEKPKIKANTQVKYINGQTYEFEIYKLVDQKDPILHERNFINFDFSTDARKLLARYIAVSLIETMRKNYGIGLAANQCGLAEKVFVIGAEGVGYAFFNPEILETSGEERFSEGCLTFPGLFLPIRRPAIVKIRYQDMNGEVKEETFSGFTARIILHEFDHLQGIVFTDLVSSIIVDREKGKIKKNLKALKKQIFIEEKQALVRKALEKMALEQKKKLDPDQALAPDPNKMLVFKA